MNNTSEEKTTILIIDDNEEILEFLKEDLMENHYYVYEARDGLEAYKILEKNVVHLIISDVMMPGMDGFNLCNKIKSDFEFSHIPVILLTAKNTLQSKIEGLNSGADAYIEKPFSPEHLNAQIQSLLKNRNKIKEYFAKSPAAHIKSMAHSKTDEEFLEKLNSLVIKNMANHSLDVEQLATMMNMSRPTLYRKIKSISDLSVNEIINLTRLKKAVELMVDRKFSLSEIVERVGYSSLNHLGRNFQKQFGMTPSDYIKKQTTQGK